MRLQNVLQGQYCPQEVSNCTLDLVNEMCVRAISELAGGAFAWFLIVLVGVVVLMVVGVLLFDLIMVILTIITWIIVCILFNPLFWILLFIILVFLILALG